MGARFLLWAAVLLPVLLLGASGGLLAWQCPVLFSASGDGGWHCCLESGFLSGRLLEQVYLGSHTASKLEYDLAPLFFTGFSLRIPLPWGWQLACGYWGALNQYLGEMRNSDYLEDDGSGGYTDTRTHYSVQHNSLLKAHFIDCALRFPLLRWHHGALTLAGGYRHQVIKCAGRDGSYQAPGTGGTDYGVIISYEQLSRIPFLEAALTWRVASTLQVGLVLRGSPLLFVEAVDQHLDADEIKREDYDSISGAWYWAMAVESSLRLQQGLALQVRLFYQQQPLARGDTWSLNTSSGEYSATVENGSGAGLHAFTCTIALQLGVGP